jgi:carotenoid 1,2-hydratase
VRPQGPRFDLTPEPGGYVWWYVDALSDDGRQGVTLIAFVGSVFSPYYAWARRRGSADPQNHCALNVALYGERGRRWTMTERGRSALHQSRERLGIGPSAVSFDGDCLRVEIAEIAAPIPRRVRGEIRVYPKAITECDFAIDPAGRHRWWPIAPSARVEVELRQPELNWSGTGYLDMNAGCEPLEQGFRRWDWSRANLGDGTLILYDPCARRGDADVLALRVDPRGEIEPLPVPLPAPLPTTGIWRIPRGTRSEPDEPARVTRTLEDTPFYARSLVQTRLLGRTVETFHESLELDRFASRWVQLLLPFRMPRV